MTRYEQIVIALAAAEQAHFGVFGMVNVIERAKKLEEHFIERESAQCADAGATFMRGLPLSSKQAG